MKSFLNYKLIFVLSLTISSIALYNSNAQGVLVETSKVSKMEFHDQINLIGRTEALVESRIVAEVNGKVAAINAAEGIKVRKGDPLITIDSSRIYYSFISTNADAEQAKVNAKLASDIYAKATKLRGKELISESTLDSTFAYYKIQSSRYEQLEADKNLRRIDLENCTIRAPYDGFTGRKLIDVGEWVQPGEPVFEMVDLSKIRITVDLPEKHFGNLSIGTKVDVYFSNNNGSVVKGKVVGISPNASKETHTFPVIVEVSNSNSKLAGGMLVRTNLYLDNKFSSLAVSKDAIIQQGFQTMVYTVNDGKAESIPVTITSNNGDMVAVTSDVLSEGMPVVIRGNERIFPGADVTISGETKSDKQAKK